GGPYFPIQNLADYADGLRGLVLRGIGGVGFVKKIGDINDDGKEDMVVVDIRFRVAYIIFGWTGASPFGRVINVKTLDGRKGFNITGLTGTNPWNGITSLGDYNRDGIN